MAGPIIKEGWANLLQPGISATFDLVMGEQPDIIPALFNVMTSDKHDEDVHTIGDISPDSWEEFSATKQLPTVGIDAGYQTTFEHTTYAVEMLIEKEWVEDDMYNLVQNVVRKVGLAAYRKRQIDALSVFNNASSGSFVGADAKALCSTTHPNGPNSSGTQSNYTASLDLTKANVSTVRLAMMNFEDDKGNNAGINPDVIVVPINNEESVFEITRSPFDPTSANNTANFHNDRFTYLTSRYLTDTDSWFMVDSQAMKQQLHWFNRVLPSVFLKNEDTTVWAKYVARMRYSFGWSDWRWIYGCNI